MRDARQVVEADIVSLHANWEPANDKMIGTRKFGLMKRGANFINTGRGELVDAGASYLKGAALDVIEHEHDREIFVKRVSKFGASSDRLLGTPHIGGFNRE